MAYEKQTWTRGDVITAEKLNHMEDGIASGGGGGGGAEFVVKGIIDWDEEVGSDVVTFDKSYNEVLAAWNDEMPITFFMHYSGDSYQRGTVVAVMDSQRTIVFNNLLFRSLSDPTQSTYGVIIIDAPDVNKPIIAIPDSLQPRPSTGVIPLRPINSDGETVLASTYSDVAITARELLALYDGMGTGYRFFVFSNDFNTEGAVVGIQTGRVTAGRFVRSISIMFVEVGSGGTPESRIETYIASGPNAPLILYAPSGS